MVEKLDQDSRTKLLQLIEEFKQFGGKGIEVISSSHSQTDCVNIAQIASETNLLSSLGTDFHNVLNNYPKVSVGMNYPLPQSCNPVYNKLGITLL